MACTLYIQVELSELKVKRVASMDLVKYDTNQSCEQSRKIQQFWKQYRALKNIEWQKLPTSKSHPFNSTPLNKSIILVY